MNNFLKAFVCGNLGKDVDIKVSGQGLVIGNFSVAVTEGVKDKEGNWENFTTWISCVAFGQLAERCGKLLSKGDKVYLEGRLKEEHWTDKDGNDKSRLSLIVNDFQAVTVKEKAETASASSSGTKTNTTKASVVSESDDDLPF